MAKRISIVIPNYNGYELLKKNLPQVLKHCSKCEIIAVDDASSDNSVNLVSRNFHKIKIVRLTRNRGFANAINRGIKEASGDLVVLLNSDVSPRANFLENSLGYFKDSEVFAVGFADMSHENGKLIVRGKGGAFFKRGFFIHHKLESTSGESLWVSAGSGIFDRQKILDLGGFDELFAPFYWEDIDLSFRAWQAGFKCLFEPTSEVDHFHKEGAIRKSRSKFFIKTVSYKNQFLFVWKNISDPIFLIQHLLWLPYHFVHALISLEIAFFAGFLWAFSKIPNLILDHSTSELSKYQLTDKEVFARFEKS